MCAVRCNRVECSEGLLLRLIETILDRILLKFLVINCYILTCLCPFFVECLNDIANIDMPFFKSVLRDKYVSYSSVCVHFIVL